LLIAYLVFSFCYVNVSLHAEIKENILKGRMISPILDAQGEFQYLYQTRENEINLVTHKLSGEGKRVRNILESDGICEPVIKKDPQGRIQLIWVNHKQEGSEIYSGILGNSGLSKKCIWHQAKGTVHSADMCFDKAGSLWAGWSLHQKSKDWVMVKNKNDDSPIVLNSSGYAEIRGLKIRVDIQDRVWVFWTGIGDGREEVFFSYYERGIWSKPGPINGNNKYPHILLDVEISPQGFPWLVWSAYDGNDYEIHESYWTSLGWSEEEPLTDNLCADLFPDINVVWNQFPFIVWSRRGEENTVFYMVKKGNHWSEESRLIKDQEELIYSPQVVTDQGRIGLVWESGQVIYSRIFHFSDLKNGQEIIPKKTTRQINVNPTLQDDVYIGFGDSITYGYIDSSPAPDLGYVPKLEEILDTTYGDSDVINEGNPAERTLGGLSRINDVLTENNGKYLLLMEGTNDVVTNSITMDTAAFNLQEMAEVCLDFGVLPLISTILPRDDIWWYIPFYKQRIYTLNDKIREIPGELKIPFIDMFNEFYYYQDGEQDWRSLLSQDGLHPNEQGYEFMAEKWFGEIQVFPFPPSIIEGRRAYDKTLFDSKIGNLIKWRENSKLSYQNIFRGYKVYRKTDSEEAIGFQQIAFLPINMMVNDKQYFDSLINTGEDYSYTVCLVRRDGVEGPCSNIMKVASLK